MEKPARFSHAFSLYYELNSSQESGEDLTLDDHLTALLSRLAFLIGKGEKSYLANMECIHTLPLDDPANKEWARGQQVEERMALHSLRNHIDRLIRAEGTSANVQQ
jgi:hypothetical protein